MRWANLNAHRNASGLNKFRAYNRSTIGNGWHGTDSGCCNCRCRCRWFRAWTKSIGVGQRWMFWFLVLVEFLQKSLHIVNSGKWKVFDARRFKVGEKSKKFLITSAHIFQACHVVYGCPVPYILLQSYIFLFYHLLLLKVGVE